MVEYTGGTPKMPMWVQRLTREEASRLLQSDLIGVQCRGLDTWQDLRKFFRDTAFYRENLDARERAIEMIVGNMRGAMTALNKRLDSHVVQKPDKPHAIRLSLTDAIGHRPGQNGTVQKDVPVPPESFSHSSASPAQILSLLDHISAVTEYGLHDEKLNATLAQFHVPRVVYSRWQESRRNIEQAAERGEMLFVPKPETAPKTKRNRRNSESPSVLEEEARFQTILSLKKKYIRRRKAVVESKQELDSNQPSPAEQQAETVVSKLASSSSETDLSLQPDPVVPKKEKIPGPGRNLFNIQRIAPHLLSQFSRSGLKLFKKLNRRLRNRRVGPDEYVSEKRKAGIIDLLHLLRTQGISMKDFCTVYNLREERVIQWEEEYFGNSTPALSGNKSEPVRKSRVKRNAPESVRNALDALFGSLNDLPPKDERGKGYIFSPEHITAIAKIIAILDQYSLSRNEVREKLGLSEERIMAFSRLTEFRLSEKERNVFETLRSKMKMETRANDAFDSENVRKEMLALLRLHRKFEMNRKAIKAFDAEYHVSSLFKARLEDEFASVATEDLVPDLFQDSEVMADETAA